MKRRSHLTTFTLLTLCLAVFAVSIPAAFGAAREATPFTLKALSGEEVSLSQLKGSPVVLVFFSTNCHFCKQEMPILQKLYEEYALKADLKVFGIAARENPERLKKFASSLGVNFPILLDETGRVFMEYMVMGVPTAFFVNPKGEIADLVIGATSEKALRDKLNSILWYRGLREVEIQNLFKLNQQVTVLDARKSPSNIFSGEQGVVYIAFDDSQIEFSKFDKSKLYLVLADDNQQSLKLCKEMALQGFRRVYFMLHAS
ncbi:TlpA family protein disulfide reductase [Atrimonas thermophila]|jgi:peroxiredoxin|uniref:TlpA family protein disulfide reductase n=1 Tax=Atrimonas thermophila TaxID=3064161 RepID=UPI00399CD549